MPGEHERSPFSASASACGFAGVLISLIVLALLAWWRLAYTATSALALLTAFTSVMTHEDLDFKTVVNSATPQRIETRPGAEAKRSSVRSAV